MSDHEMGSDTVLCLLRARRHMVRELVYVCLGLLGAALLALAVLAAGPRQLVDVHVHRHVAIMFRNEINLSSWSKLVDPLAIGLPGIAGVAIAAAALLVWSLDKCDRKLVWCCGSYLAAVVLMGPLLSAKASDTFLPDRGFTISAEAGKRRAAGLDTTLTRYMLAQAAYIEGDLADAQRLSRGLTSSKLYTRFEAPWRLKLLKGGSNVKAMECRPIIGCMAPIKATALLWVLINVSLILFGSFAVAFRVWEVLDRRIGNIACMLANE